MRELKFRAWIEKEKYMAVQGEPDLETLGSFMHHYSDCKNLMQYTGLKDKNGKEVYEGDILSNQYGKKDLVVFFENGFFGKSKTNQTTYNPLCNGYLKNKEIIGNIYENPELLKSSE
jgi:uncharacterized phage protein (TIGR01671 family)